VRVVQHTPEKPLAQDAKVRLGCGLQQLSNQLLPWWITCQGSLPGCQQVQQPGRGQVRLVSSISLKQQVNSRPDLCGQCLMNGSIRRKTTHWQWQYQWKPAVD
jgi:hypothetical protein